MSAPRLHGEAGNIRSKGGRRKPTPEYQAWINIKRRCFDPNCKTYKTHGARGVTMHAPWRDDFAAFLGGVGRRPTARHSIDRFPDPLGNYVPGNVRWALPAAQSHNRRVNLMTPLGAVLVRQLAHRGVARDALGVAFGVSRADVGRIIRGERWALAIETLSTHPIVVDDRTVGCQR